MRAGAGKALKARLAFGIDLAAVEGLALLVVAEDFIGGVEFGEFSGRFRVLFVGVGVQLFRHPPEGALDVSRTGPLGHPQDLIGVAH